MIDAIFVRVYDNTYHIVAEFRRTMPTFEESETFVLNLKNVEERISNRKKYGMSTIQETKALVAIREYELQNRK
jgi:hypothetical protein